MQVRNPSGSGADITEGKGVHREVESEGRREKRIISKCEEIAVIRCNVWIEGPELDKDDTSDFWCVKKSENYYTARGSLFTG